MAVALLPLLLIVPLEAYNCSSAGPCQPLGQPLYCGPEISALQSGISIRIRSRRP